MKKPANKPNKKNISVVRGYSLPLEYVEWLQELAFKMDHSASKMLSIILREAMNRDKKI